MLETTVILGGPGTGKTTRLMQILKDELGRGPAERIAYVSYTRQGTYQGVAIAKDQFDLSETQCMYFKTLHSIGFSVTEASVSDMMSGKDYSYFAEHVGVENIQEYLKFEEMQRNNPGVAASLYEASALDPYTTQYVCKNYTDYKRYFNKRDFTDLLEQVVEQKITLPVDVAIIDEAQDLTTLQWKAVRMLFKDAVRMYVAGDPNQSIYDWAGADYKYFMHMNADHVEVLDTTHRLPRKIWELGKQVHSMIDESTPYPKYCREDEGVLRQIGELGIVDIDPKESYLFLARANCYLGDIEQQLRDQGFLYTTPEGIPSIGKKKLLFVKAFFLYMERKGRGVPASYKKVLNKFFTDEQMKTMQEDKTYQDVFMTTVDWEDRDYCYCVGMNRHYNDDYTRLRVSSMHRVKGAEADNVYVLMDATRKTIIRFQEDPDAE